MTRTGSLAATYIDLSKPTGETIEDEEDEEDKMDISDDDEEGEQKKSTGKEVDKGDSSESATSSEVEEIPKPPAALSKKRTKARLWSYDLHGNPVAVKLANTEWMIEEDNGDLRASNHTTGATDWNDTCLRRLEQRIHFLEI